jgi:hypothetical protein
MLFYVSKKGTVVDVHSHPILKLGTRWRRLSLTPRPFYPRRKNPLYSMNRILGGPKRRLGRFRKNVSFPCLNQTALGVVTTPTELYQFLLCIHRPTYIHNIYSFIHSVICLTTGPTPLPKRFLHIVRFRASSFK